MGCRCVTMRRVEPTVNLGINELPSTSERKVDNKITLILCSDKFIETMIQTKEFSAENFQRKEIDNNILSSKQYDSYIERLANPKAY